MKRFSVRAGGNVRIMSGITKKPPRLALEIKDEIDTPSCECVHVFIPNVLNNIYTMTGTKVQSTIHQEAPACVRVRHVSLYPFYFNFIYHEPRGNVGLLEYISTHRFVIFPRECCLCLRSATKLDQGRPFAHTESS